MYQPARRPAAAAELSLRIRVSTGLFPAIHWSRKMGEQPKGKQLPVPSLRQAGHTHSQPVPQQKAAGSKKTQTAVPFPSTARLKDSELRLLPAGPAARCRSRRSGAVTAGGSASMPLLHPQPRPARTSFPPTPQGVSGTAASAVRGRRRDVPRGRRRAVPSPPSSPRAAQPAARSAAGPRTCPSERSRPCACEISAAALSKGKRLSSHFLPVLRCSLICS